MRDWGLKATLLMTALGAAGCAGGGGLELEGSAAQQIFQQYSGTWELDARRSDDPAQLLAAAAPSQGSRGGGGQGGGWKRWWWRSRRSTQRGRWRWFFGRWWKSGWFQRCTAFPGGHADGNGPCR